MLDLSACDKNAVDSIFIRGVAPHIKGGVVDVHFREAVAQAGRGG